MPLLFQSKLKAFRNECSNWADNKCHFFPTSWMKVPWILSTVTKKQGCVGFKGTLVNANWEGGLADRLSQFHFTMKNKIVRVQHTGAAIHRDKELPNYRKYNLH